MSWINSNATYKQNSKNDLSFYHGFSKTPVEPTSTGTAATTLANASTKGGHTVIGTEVWAEEIPWFGLVPSRAVAVTRLSGLTKLNDLVKVDGEGGKVYKYIGADDAVFTEAQWSSFWTEVTLTNGMVLNNRHNQPVLRYYLNQPMQTLTTTNNASIDSKGYATRLFVNEETHVGQTSGGAVVSQFAAGTDNIKNGIPSVELNPKLYLGTTEKIAGTHYYDYNVSGTILWSTAVTSSSPKISCFRYIGKTVTGQLSTVETSLSKHTADISDIKLALGLEDTNPDGTQSVTTRVETVEDVVRVLLGLGDSDAIAATESISTTANNAATSAISTALAEGGSITQKITSSINALGDVAVKSDIKISEIKVKSGSTTTTLTPDSNKSVTVEIPEVQAATTSVAGVVTISDNDAIATTETSAAAATVAAVAATRSAIASELGALAVTVNSNKTEVDGKISAIEGKLASTGEIGQAIAGVKATADSAVQSVTRATGSSTLLTVTDGTDVTISLSTEVATKSDAAAAAANAVTTGLATGGNIAQAIATAKSGAEQTAATALSTARGEITTEISDAVSGLETKLTTGEGSLGAKVAALETATGTTLPAAIEQALTDAKAYSDSLHTTSLDYVVLGDSETLPTASADTLGKIYLVASQNAPTTDGSAISGSYVEYMTRKVSETEYTWEKIGTTAADLSAYAKTADVTTAIATAKSEAIATAKAETTTQVNALAATHAADKAALEASIATKVGEVQWFGENDLLSTKAEVKDGKLVVTEQEVINPNKGIGDAYTAAWNENVTKVVNNEAFNADGEKIATIETSKIKNGKSMFYITNLSEYESDLSSLTNGTWMFSTTKIAEFIGDMSSLTTGNDMFAINDELHTFIGDLSSLTNGYCMFSYCKNLTTFISDLSSLTSGYNMFEETNLSLESIECIADTINEYEGRITISWNTLPSEDKRQALVDELSRIVDKGWTLITNKELLPLFNSEKYQINGLRIVIKK